MFKKENLKHCLKKLLKKDPKLTPTSKLPSHTKTKSIVKIMIVIINKYSFFKYSYFWAKKER